MNLKPLGANKTELHLDDKVILFSYRTPVAVNFTKSNEVWKTNTKYSKTTSKHISAWLCSLGLESIATDVDQKYIDALLNEVK